LDEKAKKDNILKLTEDLRVGGHKFGAKVARTMELKEWQSAIEVAKEVASEGKVVLKLNSI